MFSFPYTNREVEKFWWQTFQSLLEICLDVPDAHLFISSSFNNLRSHITACWLFVFIKSFPNSVLNYNFYQIEKPRCIKIEMYASIFIWAIKENAREQLRQQQQVGFHWRSIKVTESLLITLFLSLTSSKLPTSCPLRHSSFSSHLKFSW